MTAFEENGNNDATAKIEILRMIFVNFIKKENFGNVSEKRNFMQISNQYKK